jgi:ABC-type antimicrobial peptide transport system permease subunit
VLNAPGAPASNAFNGYADFLLGLAQAMGKDVQYINPAAVRMPGYGFYARDQWQVNRKLTVNYGMRFERYPFARRDHRGGERYDPVTDKVLVGGVGGTPNLLAIENMQLALGRPFSETDQQRRLMVAIIGHDFKERWFPNLDPTGKTIHVDSRPFTVIGVTRARGSIFGQTQDSFVLLPAGTYFKIYGPRRNLTYTAIAATAIAVVSVFLVVGGVVIMNIMLAVVSERTQEIGIRKSLGARRSDILNQFLVESAVLSGLGVSMAVGLFFGIWPANKAANLDPVDALRYE